MNNSRLTQTLKYQLSYFGWSSLWVYGISVFVIVALSLTVTLTVDGSSTSFGGLGGIAFLHLFILGCGIRSDLKLFLQHGIGRRTTFFNNLLGSFMCAVMLGLLCVIFDVIAGRWLNTSDYVYITGVPGFFTGWVVYICSFFFAWQLGALISLIYYRLNGLQKVIFNVLGVAALILIFTGTINYLGGITYEFGDDMIQSLIDGSVEIATYTALGLLVLAMIAAVGNYFLLRRAPIKE